MKEFLYRWVQDIAFYTLLMVLVLHVLPERGHRNYLQFFMGVVLIILVLSPVLRVTGLEQKLDEAYTRQTYDMELQEFQSRQEKLQEEYQKILEEKLEEAEWEQEEAQAEAETGDETEEGENSGIPEIHIEIGTTQEDKRD